MTKLNSRWLEITENLDCNVKRFTNAADGVDDTDLITKQQLVDSATSTITQLEFGTSSSGHIDPGAVSIDSTSNAADIVEEINTVLGDLVPPAAPDLDQISRSQSGASGKLSFGTSNPISGYTNHPSININGSYTTSGNTGGMITATQDLTGILNSDIPAHDYAYPADAFGDGDKGTLSIWTNGTQKHSVDLTSFASGASVNGNGTGFNLSVATAVEFASGATYPARKYRTGTYSVDNADLVDGYNTIEVRHSEGGLITNIYNWVVDDDTTNTTFTSPLLDTLAMTGSNDLSGVEYNTAGSAQYDLTINNPYRNTYNSSASAITHPTTTNCSVASQAIPNMTDESDTVAITNKTVTVTTGRILPSYQGGSGNQLSVSTRCLRTLQGTQTSSTTTAYNLLLDSNNDSATTIGQFFTGETRRFEAGSDFDNTTLAINYNSATSLVGTYTSELQCYNSRLIYPTYDFSSIANAPVGNPNYSTSSGTRYFYGYFTSGVAASNFRLNIQGSATLVNVANFTSGNHITMEIKLPGTTPPSSGTSTGWLDVIKSYETDKWDDGDGAYYATLGNDITIPTTNLGITVGTKSTANSGNRMYFRIKAGASWTGYLTQISITWNAS